MLSKIAKLLLVSTAFAPVLLTYALAESFEKGLNTTVISLGGITIGLVAICWFVLNGARTQLGKIVFSVTQVKSADSEMMGFVLIYLLPLINTTGVTVNTPVLFFILVLSITFVWKTNAYHFNPLLGLFGFHFYEATSSGNIVFLLITRKDIRRNADITSVMQLTEYIVLDTEGNDNA